MMWFQFLVQEGVVQFFHGLMTDGYTVIAATIILTPCCLKVVYYPVAFK